MAVAVTAINAITKQLFIPKLVDNVTTSMALLMQLQKNGEQSGPILEESSMAQPEYRLTSRSGQDRSVNQRYARTTDKGFQNGRIYSLISRYNIKKRELTHLSFENIDGGQDIRVPVNNWALLRRNS